MTQRHLINLKIKLRYTLISIIFLTLNDCKQRRKPEILNFSKANIENIEV